MCIFHDNYSSSFAVGAKFQLMKATILPFLIIVVILNACKKDPAAPIVEPAVSLKGTWKLESNRFIDYENNILQSDYTVPGNGETFNFQTNGNVVMMHDGLTENHQYTITSDTLLNIEGSLYKIRNLTSSNVTLYYRNDISPGDFDEIIQRLKK